MMLLQKRENFLLKLLYEGMTTLPFERKNNLLSLLRGYDLPIKRNFLNSALLGFGKHHHHHHKKDKKEKETPKKEKKKTHLDESEEKYLQFLITVEDSLKKYFNFFIANLSNRSFWYGPLFYDALCAFTRYFVASKTRTSTEFLNNIERFLTDIVESERYDSLLDEMDSFADEYKTTEVLPEAYKAIKVQSGNAIGAISTQCLSQDVLNLDEQTIINLIIDCVVYSTEEPQEFEITFEKLKTKITNSADKDILRLFSEDLQDTVDDDAKEKDDGKYDSEDERFVVPDGEEYIEYESDEEEEGETPAKRRKMWIVDSDDDDEEEGEVNGSGFYDWWW